MKQTSNFNQKDNETSQAQDSAKSISKLEYIGFSTGYRLIERLTREMPRFKDELDTVKFLCTDFWSSVFKKQVDNLRTNHQVSRLKLCSKLFNQFMSCFRESTFSKTTRFGSFVKSPIHRNILSWLQSTSSSVAAS